MTKKRPKIPADMEREVRQRCGFGCILCGCPIYQIHHMTPWSETRKHDAQDMTLLCAKHHEEENKKLISKTRVRKANANPVNRRRGRSGGQRFVFEEPTCTFIIGDC